MFLLILVAIFAGDLGWWWFVDRRLRRAKMTKTRIAFGAFMALQLLYLIWSIVLPGEARRAHAWMPVGVLATVYLWHLLIMPATIVVALLTTAARGVANLVREKPKVSADETALSRRAAIGLGITALPPVATALAVAVGLRQIHDFRTRRFTLAIPQLPKNLDGLTIAHVSDLHLGRFTRERMLPKILDATNSLKADLVLFTGDLIDLSLTDLPTGIDFIRKLDPRHGLAICEGNHDLIESRAGFEFGARLANLPLLLDQSQTLHLRGERVQLLGLSWSRGGLGIDQALQRLAPQRDENAFQILLAHHPHAFDRAAEMKIPLTLAGHTHGGQLMLNERLGAGPVMFKYWSGLYEKPNAKLIVSNGVGNWFPLRTHAPAEIVHLTLRCSA